VSDYKATENTGVAVDLQLQHKTVGDSVGYSPNLPQGGHADPVERSRFDENTAKITVHRGQKLSLHATIGQRQFTSLRDNFEFNAIGAGLRYQFYTGSSSNTFLMFDYSSNRAGRLSKNSYTTINNQVIKAVAINGPSDSQWNLGLQHQKRIGNTANISVYGSFGKTDTSHDGLTGLLTRGNCNYSFDFGAAGGSVNQIDTCGNLTALSRTYPDAKAWTKEFWRPEEMCTTVTTPLLHQQVSD